MVRAPAVGVATANENSSIATGTSNDRMADAFFAIPLAPSARYNELCLVKRHVGKGASQIASLSVGLAIAPYRKHPA